MANRKRGYYKLLPEEFQTNERICTKTEMAMRQRSRPCPPVPIKKKSFKKIFSKPEPISYSRDDVQLSSLYNFNQNISYLDQLFVRYGMLGEGSFGYVYKVRSREDNEIYAVKRSKSTISMKDRYAEVLNNEKVGEHPLIVQFYMAWKENSDVFMLLECCDMSLYEYSVRVNNIGEEMCWNIIHDICKALEHLHAKNLLHLDVKPGNIMIKRGYFKLADFGILVDLNVSTRISKCKSTLSDGDSKYLALEILTGIYTPACDIFGLGITVLEIAADLELPDHGPLWQQLRHDVLPEDFYMKVTLGMKILIERMLTADYEKRPTAQQILKYRPMRDLEKNDAKYGRDDIAEPYLNDMHFNYDYLPVLAMMPSFNCDNMDMEENMDEVPIKQKRIAGKALNFDDSVYKDVLDSSLLPVNNSAIDGSSILSADESDSFEAHELDSSDSLYAQNNNQGEAAAKKLKITDTPITPLVRSLPVRKLAKCKLNFDKKKN